MTVTASGTKTHNEKTHRDPIVLFAAVQTGLGTLPSLIMSMMGLLSQDPLLNMLFPDPNTHAALTTPGSGANFVFELAMVAIAVQCLGLFLVYTDGASKQPLAMATAGLVKVAGAMLSFKAYCWGSVSVWIFPPLIVPDLCLGLYLLSSWAGTGFQTYSSPAGRKTK